MSNLIEPNTIHCIDCMEGMAQMPDKYVDVIIADPPFFTPAQHYQSRVSWGRRWADMGILGEYFNLVCAEFRRIIKADGNIFVCCHDESYPVFYPVAFQLFNSVNALIWDKGRVGLGRVFRHQHEFIMWCHDSGARESDDGVLRTDVIKFSPTLSKKRIHPVEKPIALYKHLLSAIKGPDMLFLDPYAGSGTSIEAAISLDIDYIGYEIDADYFKAIEDRVYQFTRQTKLL